MARKFLTHLDLSKNELQNAAVQSLAAAPSNPVKFQLYGNSADNTLYWWDGTAWQAAKAPSTSGITQAQGDAWYVNVVGDTMTGPLVLPADPTAALQAATKQYVDGLAGQSVLDLRYVNVAGDTMQGGLYLQPTAGAGADALRVVQGQVTAGSGAAFDLTGAGSVSVPAPTAGSHATTKTYVDTHLTQAEADPLYVNAAGDTMSGTLTMGGNRILGLGTPSAGTDAVTKDYVDLAVNGLSWKDSVKAATTVSLALAGAVTLDGVSVVAGDRVLVKNQTDPTQNGIYTVTAGAWTRTPDADIEAELLGAAVFVQQGTTQADTAWIMTANAPITVGTTGLPWAQFGAGATYLAGQGLTLTGSTFDVGAGTGILVAADTVSVDTSTIATVASVNGKADKTTALTAGAGLTGGGDLSAARTFDVGAGTGITVAADAVALDTAYTDARYALAATGAKRYAVDVGGASAQVITHNLATTDVIVQVYRKASPFDQIECDVEHTSTTQVTLRFVTAPAAAEYRAVVLA